MPRDYKKSKSKSKREKSAVGGNILSFLSGLSVGLLVAFIVFLRYQHLEPDVGAPSVAPAESSRTQTEEEQPELTFTFYDTLRDKKVNISEWMAGEKDDREQADDEELDATPAAPVESRESEQAPEQLAAAAQRTDTDITGYVLQVGSFKDFSSADQIKAELALLGIFADIQRVMLNERDVRHRVRLGPYTNVDELQDIRGKLRDNRIEFMLIELR